MIPVYYEASIFRSSCGFEYFRRGAKVLCNSSTLVSELCAWFSVPGNVDTAESQKFEQEFQECTPLIVLVFILRNF